jgi:hypothetical protein
MRGRRGSKGVCTGVSHMAYRQRTTSVVSSRRRRHGLVGFRPALHQRSCERAARQRNVTRVISPLQVLSHLSESGQAGRQRDPATSCRLVRRVLARRPSPVARRSCRGRAARQMIIVHANNRHDAMVSLSLCPCPGISSRSLPLSTLRHSRIKPKRYRYQEPF